MAPLVCPEEVDVFRNPHIRMKQIISAASEKISTTNFKDKGSLYGLLQSFYDIFLELKHHEEVENSCIIKTLQVRLTDGQIRAIVKDVHKHSHVRAILALIKKGFKSNKKKKTLLNMVNYETKLRRAVDEFERDIFPHMKHEEEVFQPLLMEHFTFEELKTLKEKVDGLHSSFVESNPECTAPNHADNRVLYQLPRNYVPSSDSETTDNEIDNTLLSVVSKNLRTKQTHGILTLIEKLPPELMIKMFGYLNPKDLCRSSQVCKRWSILAKEGRLWRHVYPVRWIFKNEWRFGDVDEDECMCNNLFLADAGLDYGFQGLEIRSTYADADADLDESGDSDNNCSDGTSPQMLRLLGFSKYLLPVVGKSVLTLKLACCPLLSNGLLFKMLSCCPNVENLDLSQTAISDYGLKGLFRRGGGSRLKSLDLSGCRAITDKVLMSLSCALGEAANTDIEEGMCECTSACKCASRVSDLDNRGKRSLVHLSLSGCFQITDSGLRSLASNGGLPKLEFLDLSGCLNITAYGLCDLVFVCPSLDHAHFYYCDNIDEGPYQETASGCQNLECTNRVCCRTGE